MRISVATLVLMLVLAGCGVDPQEHEATLKQLELVRAENEVLKAEVDRLSETDQATRDLAQIEELIAEAKAKRAPQNPSLAAANVWFGPVLRELFPGGIPIHGHTYRLDKILASPADITTFSVTAGGAFLISGSLTLKALPNAVEGDRYMVHLQGYLFCGGRMVWEQRGFPTGLAWVQSSGGSKRFLLIDSYRGPTSGCTAVVLAAGDPLIMDGSSETRVILGIKRSVL